MLCIICKSGTKLISLVPPSINEMSLYFQIVLEFIAYYLVRFVPSVLVCLLCHAMTLNHICNKVTSNSNTTCHILFGNT